MRETTIKKSSDIIKNEMMSIHCISRRIYFAAVVFFLILCTAHADQKKEPLIIGTWDHFPPLIISNKYDKPKGLYIDIIDEIKKRISRPVEIKFYSPHIFLNEYLNNKEMDVSIGFIRGNPPSEFTAIGTYIYREKQIFVNKQSSRIINVEDLQGKVIAGAPSVSKSIKKYNPSFIRQYNSNFEAAYALNRGEIDAWVATNKDAFSYIVRTENLENIAPTGPILESVEYKCYVRKGDEEFANELSVIFNTMLDDGTINIINMKWKNNLQSRPYNFFERNLKYIFISIAVILSALLVVLIWNRQLRARVKTATKDLKISTERHMLVFNTAPDLLLLIKNDGCVRDCNESARKILGVDNDLPWDMFLDKIALKDRSRFEDFFYSLFDENLGEQEFKFVNCNGGERDMDVVGLLLPSAGKYGTEVCLIARDITDRREMERELVQADRLAILGKAAASLAHEINNPIGAALAYIKTLAKRDLPRKDQIEYLEGVRRNLIRASQITSKLLAVSKPRKPKMQRLVLDEVILDALGLISPQLEGMEVLFQESDQPIELYGDPMLLEQVLINLLLNAKNATTGLPKRRVAIRHRAGKEYGRVQLYVEDNGKGIPQEMNMTVFEPFVTSGEHGGVGLGLYVARQIVEIHKGALSVQSEEGKGSVFIIELPIFQNDSNAISDSVGRETAALKTEEGVGIPWSE